MTKAQREELEAVLYELDMREEERRPARAADVATALRILSARLDEIEIMAKRALLHTKGA